MYHILLATYNGEKYVGELLDSIKGQSVTDWQILAFDDGSEDGTVDILKRFAKENPGKLVLNENVLSSGSAKANFALLFQRASFLDYEYVLPADQDDVWLPDKLYKLSRIMDKAEKRFGKDVPILVHSDMMVVNDELEEISPSFFEYSGLNKHARIYELIVQNCVTGCACIINNALLKGVSNELLDDNVIMHDHWLALYASVFGRVLFTNNVTALYRQHSKNSVGAKGVKNLPRLVKRFFNERSSYKADLKATKDQCKSFVMAYGEPYGVKIGETSDSVTYDASDDRFKYRRASLRLMREYSGLDVKSKFNRVKFTVEHRMWKKGFFRKVMQILWG